MMYEKLSEESVEDTEIGKRVNEVVEKLKRNPFP